MENPCITSFRERGITYIFFFKTGTVVKHTHTHTQTCQEFRCKTRYNLQILDIGN